MKRRRPPQPAAGPAAELAAHAAAMRAAAARGDPLAADRLASAESWVTMLRDTGNDPEVAELLVVFARESALPGQIAIV